MPTIDEQVDILMSGAEYGDPGTKETMRKELHARLTAAEKDGRVLRVYCGYDPRTADLHLGHTITMRKLRQFQELGHDVTFLIGSFTSLIGDPSDKDKARDQLTVEQVHENARTYADQAFKILDRELTRVRFNDEWLATLDFADIIRLASNFTVQQFLVRENFKRRLDDGLPIYLHEEFAIIREWWVEPAFRRRGAGKALINLAVKELAAVAVCQLRVRIAAGDADARELLGRCGFRAGAFEMVKDLQPSEGDSEEKS